MTGIKQLLIDLAEDARLADEYEQDPKSVMKRYELNDEETRAMLDKDLKAIRKLSGLSKLKSNGNVQAYDYQ